MTSDEDRQRRLLDLLSGWAESAYLRPAVPATEEQAAIAALYQRVGAIEAFAHEDYLMVMREIDNIVRTGGASASTP